MKKWIFLLALMLVSTSVQAQYVGIYGQYLKPQDTVRFYVTVHDTTGLGLIAWDSANFIRYYNGVRIDTIGQDSTAYITNRSTGIYELHFRADKETNFATTDKDSIGTYNITGTVFVKGKSAASSWTYQVIRGDGLDGLFDIQWFLGAAKNGYRVLFPVGAAPKDSAQYYGIFDKDGDGATETGDTTFISTIHFYHSIVPQILDSSKIIYHYTDL